MLAFHNDLFGEENDNDIEQLEDILKTSHRLSTSTIRRWSLQSFEIVNFDEMLCKSLLI